MIGMSDRRATPPTAPLRMSREEYRRWAEQTGRRAERVGGEVILMAPERAAHNRVKANIHVALKAAIQ